jgi:arsenate reductase
MIDTIFYMLRDTLSQIIKTLPKGLILLNHDIKQDPITVEQLSEMYQMAGSYEALFSKKKQTLQIDGTER